MKEASVAIYYGHNACVAVAIDSRLVAVFMEERFSKLKNAVGFPILALTEARKLLSSNNVKWADVDFVIPDKSLDGLRWLNHNGWEVKPYNFTPGKGKKQNPLKAILKPVKRAIKKLISPFFNDEKLVSKLALKLETESHRILFVDHHLSHISCANEFYNSPEGIAFVVDAIGDRKSFSVWLADSCEWKEIVSGNESASLGYFYSAITEVLGLKPNEHEFKVMGMAPYGDERYANSTIKELRKIVSFNCGLPKVSKSDYKELTHTLSELLKFHRFDQISYSAQLLLEEVFCQVIEFWCKELRSNIITLSGGVMMNVKLVKRVSELDCVKELRIVPSSGDESLVIGALHATGKVAANERTHLYLGADTGPLSVDQDLTGILVEDYSANRAAELIEKDQIGALCWGKEEWGARALGHRSIICRPDRFKNIERINATVKKRDFWMPFTPSIIEESWDKYISENTISKPYFMASTFSSTELGREHLEAAVHPRDYTVRGQLVRESDSPKYYALIKSFSSKSGIGALLNTSFNLHGMPNVQTADDAFLTFKNSALDFLVIEDKLYVKSKVNTRSK